MTTIEAQLLEAADRLELTEQGWIEKVTHPAHGRMVTRVIAHLLRLGVPEACIYDNTRLTPDADGLRYIPDVMVIRRQNPMPVDDLADYAGVPDLVVEVLSPGEANRQRDFMEKSRRYAQRGVPTYWIVDPADRMVTDLRLLQSPTVPTLRYYEVQGNRPHALRQTPLPWQR